MLPINILRYGRPDPLPPRVPLRAGPLLLYFQDGGLRDIRLGEVEVVRRIYVAVRDRNWATVAPDYTEAQMDLSADSFCIAFTARHRQGEADAARIDFVWRAQITGSADGVIAFEMDGCAQSTFLKNRIGFCVLLPAGSAGAACHVEHVDGRVERARLPEFITPDQPAPPFADMRALRHPVAPDDDVWVEVRFEGDVFEMEDQRNWTDASFKIFCTPLRLPFPVQIEAGTRIAQSVRVSSTPPPRSLAVVGATLNPQSLSIRAGALCGHRLLCIGLGMASHGQPLSPREVARLKALGPAHLRVDLRPADPDCSQVLQHATAEAHALGVPLEVAVLVPQQGEADAALRQLARWLNEMRPDVARWLVYPDREFSGSTPLSEATLRLVRDALTAYDPAAPFVAGTNTDFIFLQRALLPALLDMVCLAINPQAHAFDNASLMETTQTQATVVRSARRLAGGRSVVVSPVTLKPRFNPYATGSLQQAPPDQLPAQVDARQMALFAASWTVASLKYLAESGAHSVTYYETTGWRGVMETETGSPAPALFPSIPGGVFPVYHVLADAGEFVGGDVAAGLSSDPSRVVSLVLRRGSRQRILIANLTEDAQLIAVEGLSAPARVLTLDERTAEQAMRSPEMFRQQHETRRASRSGPFDVWLGPYGVARVDS